MFENSTSTKTPTAKTNPSSQARHRRARSRCHALHTAQYHHYHHHDNLILFVLTFILLFFATPSTAHPLSSNNNNNNNNDNNPTNETSSIRRSLTPFPPTPFAASILNSTNTYRASYNASSLIWNTTLASYAQHYLDLVAPSPSHSIHCDFSHSGGPYGENLAIGYKDAQVAVEAWGDEGKEYDFERPGFTHETGHFSQLVWKGTRSVGCARADCGRWRGEYVVCEYWPPGNVIGRFEAQVGRMVGDAGGRGRGKGMEGWMLVVVGGVVVWMGL